MDWEAVWLSLRLAGLTTAWLMIVAPPLAFWLARPRHPVKSVLEAIVALPLVLPPTVLGFYLLMAMGPRSPLGAAYEAIVGYTLPFTFWGLLVASFIYSLPFAVQPLVSAFEQLDPAYLEAARSLGDSSLRAFFRVALPMSVPALVTAAVLSFAHTLGEFGVVLMVGGNIPGETRTISIAIYDEVQALDYSSANEMALLLVAVSVIVLSITYAMTRRRWAVWVR